MTQNHGITLPKELSTFGQTAIELDAGFAELTQLRGEIDHVSLTTDKGLDRAAQLLVKFADCGQRVSDGVLHLAEALAEARARAEEAAQAVSARAERVRERRQLNDRMLERFRALGENARRVTQSMGELKAQTQDLPPEQLTGLDTQLGDLVAEARQLKEDAHAATMRELERNADAFSQSLESARRKLKQFATRLVQGGGPVLQVVN